MQFVISFLVIPALAFHCIVCCVTPFYVPFSWRHENKIDYFNDSLLHTLTNKKGTIHFLKMSCPLGGAEGNRTPVQTYSSKAFYMLIPLLLVGDEPEMNKPIHHLAE